MHATAKRVARTGRERFQQLQQSRRLAIRFEQCRRHPTFWLERYAWSLDEHRRSDNERPLIHGEPWLDDQTMMPTRELGKCQCSPPKDMCQECGEDDYLRLLATTWWQEELVAVPKSRQLRVTHLFGNLHGWLAMMYPGQRIAIQSKKEEDADEILKRIDNSLRIMREKHPQYPWPQHRYKHTRIIFPNGSILMAVAQGPATVRQYTFSAIFSDEQGFQQDAEAAFTAAVPTIEGGGKYTAVSTANPGFFKNLVHDETEAW